MTSPAGGPTSVWRGQAAPESRLVGRFSVQVPVVRPDATAALALASVRSQAFDSVAEIAVCEGARLRGLVRIEDLLIAPPDTPIDQLMDSDPPIVAPGMDQERAAWKAVKHGERSLALVDTEGSFLGLVPPLRLLSVLLAEHDADMARLGGFLHDAEAARTATSESIGRRFLHRVPWLVLGLFASLLAADLVGAFEGRLQDHLLLAFFIPGIVYLADAVGTQTEAVIIRGLSVGVSVRDVVFRELTTGVLVGAALAALLLPMVWWRWHDREVAVAVSIALFIACSLANALALLLPVVMRSLRVDPAFGSGPLATVTQDLLSILIYFLVASWLVG